MRQRSLAAGTALLALGLTALGAWALRGESLGEASSLSPGPRGLRGARLYLEAAGAEVEILDRPLSEAPEGRALWVAFPWRRLPGEGDLDALDRFLARGGAVLVGYSGEPFSMAESFVLERLGLVLSEARPRPPLHPFRWREYVSEQWRLAADQGLEVAPGQSADAVLVSATRQLPTPPPGARVLYRAPGGRPAVFEYGRGKGRVVAFPAEAFANARLRAPGNAALLEGLRRAFGSGFTFDEFHHGFAAVPAEGDLHPQRVLDLYLLHVVFLYGVAILALARRFGPPFGERALLTSSTGAFLLALGARHRRLGHDAQAARLLVDRARELDPRLVLPADLLRWRVGGKIDLLDVARNVAAAQSSGRSKA
jgi:hypothetical protein